MSRDMEIRTRIGEASKLRWADPEYRKRQSESRRRAWVQRKAQWARRVESATRKLKCKVCKAGFVPRFTGGLNAQKYCSEKCRDTAYNRRALADPVRRARRNERARSRMETDQQFRERRRQSTRNYQANHPEKAKAATRRWVANNLEHLAEYARRRRSSNPERFRQQQRDQYHRLREAARRKTPGAKRNPIFADAYRLRQTNPPLSWGRIAIKLLPTEYRIDPERTVDKLKKGVKYLRKNGKANQ